MIHRWCSVLESYRSPDAAEVLRIACADALCVAGVPPMSRREHNTCSAIVIKYWFISKSVIWYTELCCNKASENVDSSLCRLANTSLYLLQDQSQLVRMKTACFISMLQHARGGNQRGVYLMQVNQAMPFVLDLLDEECWDTPGTLEVMLCHLPPADLGSLLREASETGCVTSSIQRSNSTSLIDWMCLTSFCLIQVCQSVWAGWRQCVCWAPSDVWTCAAVLTADGWKILWILGVGTEPECMGRGECCTGATRHCSMQTAPAR